MKLNYEMYLYKKCLYIIKLSMTECIKYNDETAKITKMENMTKYMSDYRKKKPDNWYGRTTGTICGITYTNSCKSSHIGTLKHQYGILKKEYEKVI